MAMSGWQEETTSAVVLRCASAGNGELCATMLGEMKRQGWYVGNWDLEIASVSVTWISVDCHFCSSVSNLWPHHSPTYNSSKVFFKTVNAYSTLILTVALPVTVGGGSGSIHLDDVSCAGAETTLLQCPTINFVHNCHHHEDAGVRCVSPMILPFGADAGDRVMSALSNDELLGPLELGNPLVYYLKLENRLFVSISCMVGGDISSQYSMTTHISSMV